MTLLLNSQLRQSKVEVDISHYVIKYIIPSVALTLICFRYTTVALYPRQNSSFVFNIQVSILNAMFMI